MTGFDRKYEAHVDSVKDKWDEIMNNAQGDIIKHMIKFKNLGHPVCIDYAAKSLSSCVMNVAERIKKGKTS